MARLRATLFGVVACLSEAAVLTDANFAFDEEVSGDKDQVEANLSSVASSEVASSLEALSDTILDPQASDDSSIPMAVNAIASKMDLASATKVVSQAKLPPEVSTLVQTVSDGDSGLQFDEKSMEKARVALNELVEKAWGELDDKIFKCKGFQDMNRNNYGQVVRDIMRLIEQINDLERIEAEAIEGISQKEMEIRDVEALIEKETRLYNIEYATNSAELTIRQNDLDVFQFILVFTKCKDATSLSQVDSQVCEMRSGRKTIFFHDKDTAKKYKKMLNPSTKKSIDQILRSVEGDRASFLQQPTNSTSPALPQKKDPVIGEDGMACMGATGQVEGEAETESGGAGMGDEDECMKRCTAGPPDCGLLHDKLSLMWGEYKDQVDELTMEMMHNQVKFEELKITLNAQIRLLVTAKARFQQLLAEARSNLAADRAELKEKYNQKAKLNRQYYRYMFRCKKRIQWIMYQDMCAIKVVRNAVLENSTKCPSATIQDCDLDAWVPGQCTVSCDDECNPYQPFKCGGWKKMTRQVVVQPDECGIKCPLREKYIRCGQYKCPVDCHMSSWSGWSKCTADCEGGLESHTRNIMVKPKNGGEQCNTVEESRPCNTQSCDRNCRLQRWTRWTPCSVACGGGFREKFRHVLIPTRGEGKCPNGKSRYRYWKGRCNTHNCNGDEICIAKQDLVIAVDGSGSVRQNGFDILQKYTKALLARYQMKFFGETTMRIGIALFGNGVIMPDGKTVSPALNKQKLTDSMADVEKAVDGLTWKKGFTNMAQAFALAEDMFIKGARREAQQAVMLITDGKPSFAFMTNEMAEQLDDKGIMRYFVVVNDQGPNSDVMKQIKEWASQPWETNLVHVQGGLVMLDADLDLWVTKALTKFCPMAYSPGEAEWEEKRYGYAHVKDSGWCGEKKWSNILSRTVVNAEQCAALAVGASRSSFMLGGFFRRGWCIGGTAKVDAAQYNTWVKNKINPECKESKGWRSSMLYDFYAVEPVAASSSAP